MDDPEPWDWHDVPDEPDEPRTSPIPLHVEPAADEHWHRVDDGRDSPTYDSGSFEASATSRRGRHYREDEAEDPGVYGLHSM